MEMTLPRKTTAMWAVKYAMINKVTNELKALGKYKN